MKEFKSHDEKFSKLRQLAESNVDTTLISSDELAALSPEEIRLLIHELRVHQIELEMQNEELQDSQQKLEISRDKYLYLYDFAPVSYYTIDRKGIIVEVNLTGAVLLGSEKANILGKPLTQFIKKEEQDTYYLHRRQIWQSPLKQYCELNMLKADGTTFIAQIESIATQDNTYCKTIISDITLRKQVEIEIQLRTVRENLQNLFNTIEDFIFVMDKQGRIIEANSTVYKRLGYTPKELFSIEIIELCPPALRPQAMSILGNVFAGRENVHTLPLITKTGETIATETRITLGKWNDQTVYFGVSRDISERKRIEEALRDSEARYRAVVEEQTELICRCLPNTTLTFVNEAYCRYFGKSYSELIGKSFLPLIPEEMRDTTLNHMRSFITQPRIVTWEHLVIAANGQVRWQQSTNRPIFDTQGQISEILSVGRDITERKQAEEKLQKQEQILRAILNATTDTLMMLDVDSTCIIVNPTGASRFGMQVEEMIGKRIFNLLPPEVLARRKPVMEQVIETKQAVYLEDERQGKWFGGNFYPVLNETGNVTHIVIFAQDITARKNADDALKKAHKAYTTILDSLEAAVHVIDMHTYEIIFANRYTQHLITSDPAQESNLPVTLQQPHITQQFKKQVREGEAIGIHTWEYHNPVTQHWFYIQDSAIRWIDGRIVQLSIATDITERKQIEEALRISEERFNLAMQGANDGLWDWNLITNEMYFSPRWKQMLGYEEPELSNHIDEWKKRVHPDDLPLAIAHITAYFTKKIPTLEYIHRIQHKNGHYVWILSRGLGVWDKQDKPCRAVGTHVDMTAQKQSEDALRKSELFHRILIEEIPIGLAMFRMDGIIGEVNSAFANIIGYSVDTITNKLHYKDITPPEYIASDIEQDDIVKRVGRFGPYEKEYIHRQGHRVPVRLSGIVIEHKGKRFIWTSVEDITDKKQAEQLLKAYNQKLEQEVAERTKALREQKSLLRSVIDNIPLFIFWKDRNSVYLGCNRRFAQFLQLHSPNEIVGKTNFDLNISKQDAEKFHEFDLAVVSTNTPQFHRVQQLQLPHGQMLWIEDNRIPLHDDNDQVIGILITSEDITERKQMEEALRDSERFARSTIDALSAHICVLDEKGTIIATNKAWRYFAELNPPARNVAEGSNYLDVCDSADGPCAEEAHPFVQGIRAVMRGEIREFTLEYPCHAPWEKRWFIAKVTRFPDNIEPIRLVVAHENITDRKLAEEALRASEERFNLAMRGASDGLWDWNLLTGEVYRSPRFKQMLGFAENEIGNDINDVADLIHPDDIESMLEAIKAYLSGQSSWFEYVFRMRHKNGHYVWILSRGFALRDKFTSKPFRFVGTHVDMTAQKQVELELQEAKDAAEQANIILNQFKMTLDMMIDAVVMFDANTLKILYVNQGAVNQVGYNETEFLQMTPLDIKPEFDRTRFEQLLIPLRRDWQPVITFETVYQHKNGTLVPVEVILQSQTVKSTEGEEKRFIAVVRDITERKHAEAKLYEAKEVAEKARITAEVANRAKSAFLANMSHELRTPLNGILGYAQILNADQSLTPAQREGIDVIQRSGEYLLTLINDILDLSKIEAERLELHPEDFRLNEFINGIVDLFHMRAHQKGVSFHYETLSSLPVAVHADEKRLRQILINLLGNAVKFTEKGQVYLKVGYHNHKIRFQVEDTGIGIAADKLESIFLPFQQVGKDQYRSQGTGLGLSISKKLVEMMGGKLQVVSQLGVGSTFWIELDLPEAKFVLKSLPVNKPLIVGYQDKNAQPYKIMVVDDKHENRAILLGLLTPLGFTVMEAVNGQEAINQAMSWRPNVILMDLVMPILDGFAATREIRTIPELQDVIIIAVSASAFDFHQQQSIVAGCNDFIVKPFRMEVLLEHLQKHLNLTWIYEQSGETVKENHQIQQIPDDLPLLYPSEEQSLVLLDLAMSGDVNGLFEYIEQLESENKQLVTFSRKVYQLTKQFDFDSICTLVKQGSK